jgi:hypothetical protein
LTNNSCNPHLLLVVAICRCPVRLTGSSLNFIGIAAERIDTCDFYWPVQLEQSVAVGLSG